MSAKTFLFSLFASLAVGLPSAHAAALTLDAHSKYSGYPYTELGISELILTPRQDFTAVGREALDSAAENSSLSNVKCNFQSAGIKNLKKGIPTHYQFSYNPSTTEELTLDLNQARVIYCSVHRVRTFPSPSLDEISALFEKLFVVQGIGIVD